jgi:hypothetical protein
MMLVATALASSMHVHAACAALEDEMFRARQLEHLADRAALMAGAGPAHPPAIASISTDTVVFASDQNGDGIVDTTTSETTALEVRQVSGEARVRIKLGRQTMSVLEEAKSTATLQAFDVHGNAADATHASLLQMTITPPDAKSARSMWIAVPARTMP